LVEKFYAGDPTKTYGMPGTYVYDGLFGGWTRVSD